MEFLWFLLIGAAAGWLAGQIMKSNSGDLLTNIIVGVIGSILGGGICHVAGVFPAGGLLGSLLVATLGAVLLIWLLRKIRSV